MSSKTKIKNHEKSAASEKEVICHTPNSHHENVIISWVAPEYIQYHKEPRWYYAAGIIIFITLVISFLTDNWTFALSIITLAAVYQYLHMYHPPRDIAIVITDMGIHVGQIFFPYSHIQSFWIIYNRGIRTLNLRVTNRFYADLTIQLNDQNPVKVREYLVGQIVELEGKNESLGDVILRLLKL